MPLTTDQISIILEQLKKENASEFVETLLLQYANDVKRTSHLLSLIPKISENQLKIVNNEVIEHSLATNLLLSSANKNKTIDFATLLYTSKVCFPRGNCEGASQSGKEFFNKFIEAIKNKKGFDYESKKDWNWICDIADCEEWMLYIIRQNIKELDQ